MTKKEILSLSQKAFDFLKLNKLDQAKQTYHQIIDQYPSDDQSWHLLGIIESVQRNYDDASILVEQAIKLHSWCPEYYNTLAGIYRELGRQEESVGLLRKATHFDSERAEIWNNLGMVHMDLGDFVKAYESYQKALSLDPIAPFIHFNYALSLLACGHYEQGWKEYEWRHQLIGVAPPLFPQQTDLHGKRIKLVHEQGLGDTIQFIRYAKKLKDSGAKEVSVSAPTPLERLLRTCLGVDSVNAEGDFDFTIPVMSLPGIFKGEIVSETPYFDIKDEFAFMGWGVKPWDMKIGIMCSSTKEDDKTIDCDGERLLPSLRSLAYKSAQKRSVQLEWFKKVSELPVWLYNLNRETSSCSFFCYNWVSPEMDLMETATIIKQLDLIISIDTSIAHLAGALGKPVWLLLPYNAEWRWLTNRDDSPWYPKMRIFRQTKHGDWQSVIDAIYTALINLS